MGALPRILLLMFSSEFRFTQMVAEKNLKTSVLKIKSHEFKLSKVLSLYDAIIFIHMEPVNMTPGVLNDSHLGYPKEKL